MSEVPASNAPVVHELNARRLLCPLPVIRTQNALKTLPVGARLQVFCTDPGTVNDIPAWVRINGHLLLEQHNDGREQIFLIEKRGD
ncbi:sulfurtransferase TusA family protein [Permianibacter fluminis]|uniref:sulfurtransferase TusA family protein n=1 Tax=Permianibacter fluminis TaxID=2738515 RepID=UPI0015524812|nr:sulfurtransferase TusA family protein [Permianibacter fluminis]